MLVVSVNPSCRFARHERASTQFAIARTSEQLYTLPRKFSSLDFLNLSDNSKAFSIMTISIGVLNDGFCSNNLGLSDVLFENLITILVA